MRTTTARSIIVDDVPGQFQAEIADEQFTLSSLTFDRSWGGRSFITFDKVPQFEPGEKLAITVTVANSGSTFAGGLGLKPDPNNCTEGLPDGENGTEFRLVVAAPKVGTNATSQCIRDKPAVGSTQTESITTTFTAPSETGINELLNVWVELSDGTRITPKYGLRIQTAKVSDSRGSGDLSDPGEETDKFTFDLDAYSWGCSVSDRSIKETGQVKFDVTLEGFLPAGMDGVEVPVEFLLDGKAIASDSAFITVNGGTTASVTLSGVSPGSHELAYRVGNQPRDECGTLTVEPVFDPNSVSVTCSRKAAEVAVGETFDLTVTVSNDNSMAASVAYDVVIGGSVAGSNTLTVPARDQRVVDVPVVIERSGEFDITVEATVSEA